MHARVRDARLRPKRGVRQTDGRPYLDVHEDGSPNNDGNDGDNDFIGHCRRVAAVADADHVLRDGCIMLRVSTGHITTARGQLFRTERDLKRAQMYCCQGGAYSTSPRTTQLCTGKSCQAAARNWRQADQCILQSGDNGNEQPASHRQETTETSSQPAIGRRVEALLTRPLTKGRR